LLSLSALSKLDESRFDGRREWPKGKTSSTINALEWPKGKTSSTINALSRSYAAGSRPRHRWSWRAGGIANQTGGRSRRQS
jgi:hypothetical protein